MKGFFIVLDGLDGCGKTRHSRILCEELQVHGFNVVYTAEPSKGIVGALIQTILQSRKILPEVEALLFAADRHEHLKKEILPNLQSGKVVVCDRYLYSSLAYQGAQGVDLNWIRTINNFAVKPDAAFYLDVPPDVGLGRITRKKTVLENLDLQKKVRERYLNLVQEGELELVNSDRPLEEVSDKIFKLVIQKIQ